MMTDFAGTDEVTFRIMLPATNFVLIKDWAAAAPNTSWPA